MGFMLVFFARSGSGSEIHLFGSIQSLLTCVGPALPWHRCINGPPLGPFQEQQDAGTYHLAVLSRRTGETAQHALRMLARCLLANPRRTECLLPIVQVPRGALANGRLRATQTLECIGTECLRCILAESQAD